VKPTAAQPSLNVAVSASLAAMIRRLSGAEIMYNKSVALQNCCANIVAEAQLNANRKNPQHSTGPRTPEGKAKAALNAGRHFIRRRVTIR
jgi:hypothetical protein